MSRPPKDIYQRAGLDVKPRALTDLGNAERFAERHREDVRFCYEWRKWLAWDGRRWNVDLSGAVERKAKATVRTIYAETESEGDEDRRRAIAKHAIRSEAHTRLNAMVGLSRSESGIPIQAKHLDKDPWLLNVENGTIDLRSGELREHSRADLITKLAPVEYDPDAEAPTWEAFLREVLPSEDLRGFLRRAIGYTLTGDTSERAIFLLHGTRGKNGKSTFLEAIRDILGDHAMKTSSETLLAKPAGGIPNDIARLKGARFVAASETEANRRLAEAMVKEITGRDTISARFLYGEHFDFRPEFKVWLATNHKPEVKGTDPAIWDRIRLVPFEVRIPEERQDKRMPEKLCEELPGILAWAVEGCREWQREGLGEPREVKAATESYRKEQDVLGKFIEDRCVVGSTAITKATPLYQAYRQWCDETGETAVRQVAFGQGLAERGFESGKNPVRDNRVNIWRGIGLLSGQEA
jgi:putative DNA primase/helicase